MAVNKKIVGACVGVALVCTAGFAKVESTPKLSIDSNYLSEKGYTNCGANCQDIEAGYNWANQNKVCDAKYDLNNSKYYNIGVVARAWDVCAYSDGNTPI